MQSDSVAVKAALLDVVDFLHQWADVHRALHMPDQGRLTDAARYLQQLCFAITKYRLDRLAIPVLYSADDLRLEGDRCVVWRSRRWRESAACRWVISRTPTVHVGSGAAQVANRATRRAIQGKAAR
jgi:hypothetical protein